MEASGVLSVLVHKTSDRQQAGSYGKQTGVAVRNVAENAWATVNLDL
jgi:hypothetical protein